MSRKLRSACPECAPSYDRRTFIQAVGGVALAGVVAPMLPATGVLQAAPTPTSAAETIVGRLFTSLSDKQKEVMCFPFEHSDRQKINANWHITKPVIKSDFYTKDQQV